MRNYRNARNRFDERNRLDGYYYDAIDLDDVDKQGKKITSKIVKAAKKSKKSPYHLTIKSQRNQVYVSVGISGFLGFSKELYGDKLVVKGLSDVSNIENAIPRDLEKDLERLGEVSYLGGIMSIDDMDLRELQDFSSDGFLTEIIEAISNY